MPPTLADISVAQVVFWFGMVGVLVGTVMKAWPWLARLKDFVDDLMGQSFQIRNPNAVASCGCGTSFSV